MKNPSYKIKRSCLIFNLINIAMDTSTTYMGLPLDNPLIVASSSLTADVESVVKCAESGAGAIILKSLYEEQILLDSDTLVQQDEMYLWYPEAFEYINNLTKDEGVDKYLTLIRDCKKSVNVPIIASINCMSHESWPVFSRELENAGADALELNITIFPDSDDLSCTETEERHVRIVEAVRSNVNIPVAAKISFYQSNIRLMARKIVEAGAKGLVLFNRYYRPDIDIEKMHMTKENTFSGPEEMTLPLRWIGLLSGKVHCDLVACTGIHTAQDMIKQLLAGASAVQMCSVFYRHGIYYINTLLEEMKMWMRKKGFTSLDAFKGLINKDPKNSAVWERIHFMENTRSKNIRPIGFD